MTLFDTHCHLQFDKLRQNLPDVLAGAWSDDVKKMVCVGTTLEDSAEAAEIARENENVWSAAGVHPHDAEKFIKHPNGAKDLAKLLNKSSNPKIVAVGEIGLDYYKNYCPRKAQTEALRIQLEIGLEAGLPFIFHVRDAWEDFWKILDGFKDVIGVVHSFSATTKQLDEVLARGLYVGLNGIMTFTKDKAQLEAAKKVPQAKLVLETDAPFLAPVGFRGQTCEPRHVAVTARFLAELRGEEAAELAAYTTANAARLFGITE